MCGMKIEHVSIHRLHCSGFPTNLSEIKPYTPTRSLQNTHMLMWDACALRERNASPLPRFALMYAPRASDRFDKKGKTNLLHDLFSIQIIHGRVQV